jgi:hypothetical protein
MTRGLRAPRIWLQRLVQTDRRIFPVHLCRKAVGDALECDVVKRENEMTPLDARAGDHESMTNRELQMLHRYPRHESGAGDGPLHQHAAGRNSEPLHQRRQRVQRHSSPPYT